MTETDITAETTHAVTEGMGHLQHAEHGGHAGPFYNDPTFWVALSIVIFVVLVWKTVKRIFIKQTTNYADDVAGQLANAKKLRAEAESLISQYRQKQKQGVVEAEAIITAAKRDAESMRKGAIEDLASLIAAREKQTFEKIERIEAEIIKDLRLKTANMAIDATQAILREVLDAHKTANLVDQAIREMPKQLH